MAYIQCSMAPCSSLGPWPPAVIVGDPSRVLVMKIGIGLCPGPSPASTPLTRPHMVPTHSPADWQVQGSQAGELTAASSRPGADHTHPGLSLAAGCSHDGWVLRLSPPQALFVTWGSAQDNTPTLHSSLISLCIATPAPVRGGHSLPCEDALSSQTQGHAIKTTNKHMSRSHSRE